MVDQLDSQSEGVKQPIIGTDNFVSFLCQQVSTQPIERYSKTITLPPTATKMIEDMYSITQMTTDKGKLATQGSKGFLQSIDAVPPGFSVNVKPEKSETPLIAEQARLLDIDKDTLELGVTGPVFGEGYQIDIMPLIRESVFNDKVPLLPAHTHPKDVITSIPDYFPLLLQLTTGKRLSAGFLVVCPEFQVLTLATNDTPTFSSHEELASFLFGRHELMQKGESELGLELARELKQLAEYKADLETLEEARRMIVEKLGEEGGTGFDKAAKAAGLRQVESSQVGEFMSHRTNHYKGELARHTNRTQYSFARELMVKQYISFDSITFKEFSA